jgi:hypothetical protein
MQNTLRTFRNAELLTMRQLLRDAQLNLPAFNDGESFKEMQVIIDKITDDLLYRIADGA